jgi:hypothetical protein
MVLFAVDNGAMDAPRNWQRCNEGRTNFSENLRASLFGDDLSKEPTFSQIHLAGQYLLKISLTQYAYFIIIFPGSIGQLKSLMTCDCSYNQLGTSHPLHS